MKDETCLTCKHSRFTNKDVAIIKLASKTDTRTIGYNCEYWDAKKDNEVQFEDTIESIKKQTWPCRNEEIPKVKP